MLKQDPKTVSGDAERAQGAECARTQLSFSVLSSDCEKMRRPPARRPAKVKNRLKNCARSLVKVD